jgi:hypothetical protein
VTSALITDQAGLVLKRARHLVVAQAQHPSDFARRIMTFGYKIAYRRSDYRVLLSYESALLLKAAIVPQRRFLALRPPTHSYSRPPSAYLENQSVNGIRPQSFGNRHRNLFGDEGNQCSRSILLRLKCLRLNAL